MISAEKVNSQPSDQAPKDPLGQIRKFPRFLSRLTSEIRITEERENKTVLRALNPEEQLVLSIILGINTPDVRILTRLLPKGSRQVSYLLDLLERVSIGELVTRNQAFAPVLREFINQRTGKAREYLEKKISAPGGGYTTLTIPMLCFDVNRLPVNENLAEAIANQVIITQRKSTFMIDRALNPRESATVIMMLTRPYLTRSEISRVVMEEYIRTSTAKNPRGVAHTRIVEALNRIKSTGKVMTDLTTAETFWTQLRQVLGKRAV